MEKGFSLIEILFVLVIISILALVAYPNYQNSLTKTHYLDATTALLDLATRLEQFHAETHTYETATIAQHKPTDVINSATTKSGWYTLRLMSATQSNYTLSATPLEPQAHRDKQCQTFTLTSTGHEGIAPGPAGIPQGTAEKCWS